MVKLNIIAKKKNFNMAYKIPKSKAKEQKNSYEIVDENLSMLLPRNKAWDIPKEEKIFPSWKTFNQEIEKRDYQNIEGLKAEITEKDFDYFLEVLPPMKWKSGKDEGHFYLSEFLTGNLTTKFSYKVINGKKRYFAEVVNFPKETGITKENWEMDYYG